MTLTSQQAALLHDSSWKGFNSMDKLGRKKMKSVQKSLFLSLSEKEEQLFSCFEEAST